MAGAESSKPRLFVASKSRGFGVPQPQPPTSRKPLTEPRSRILIIRPSKEGRMSDAPLMLSVSGLRGLVGKTLTPAVAARYAAAFGEFLKQTRGGDSGG